MTNKYLKYSICTLTIIITQIIIVLGLFFYISYSHNSNNNYRQIFLSTFFKKPLIISGSTEEQFMQAQSNTCGPAALAYLLNAYGLMLSEDEISQKVNLTERGCSLFDLINAAKEYGFNSWGEKQNFKGLIKTKLPALVHINNRHYVIIDRIDDYYLTLFDPAMGTIRIKREHFLRAWTGYTQIVRVIDTISTEKEVIGNIHETQ